ncbi:MAG: ferritin-like domain-containing protein [Gemmatimonadales bacterium]|nr:ferritin-like domain-containing protein [Gemmatimonadales bacterium]
MDSSHEPGGAELAFLGRLAQATSRRSFLKWSGVTLGVVAVGCSNDTTAPGATVDLGTGDTAILNLAYVLEQLEAAYYGHVVDNFYKGVTTDEKQILIDIRDHEAAHRDFFRAALGANAISQLQFNFIDIDFTLRSDVLLTARNFEDLGVAAYNGAGPLLMDPNLLMAAGSIVSVEARHASAIRDLIAARNAATGFAGDDVVDAQGLDQAWTPNQVLTAAAPNVAATITASNLP